MILNVSGRCDIVAFYSDWFINRYRAGYVDVRNPFNPKLISRINFDDVDMILFCTKNPIPIIDKIKEIDKPISFHVTLTSYKEDIEPNVPSKKLIIDAIKKLSNMIGSENITIRYDPIFLSDKYNLDYHIKAFERVCSLLDGYAKRILISFIDDYKNVRNNKNYLKHYDFSDNDYKSIGENFSRIAKEHGMRIFTCFEDNNLVQYGFDKDECLSHEAAFKYTGKKYKNWTARKGQKCNCVQMVDIGVYNSCKHFCKYCYANYDEGLVYKNCALHSDDSSLLIGEISNDDIIKIRTK